MNELTFKSGGFFSNFEKCNITFTKPIVKLFLSNCNNCTINIEDKCFTRVELLRCHNIKLNFKKQVYNLHIDLSSNIDVNINKKYKDLLNPTFLFDESPKWHQQN